MSVHTKIHLGLEPFSKIPRSSQESYDNFGWKMNGHHFFVFFLFSFGQTQIRNKTKISPSPGFVLTDLLNKEVVNNIGSNPKEDR